MKNRFKTFGGVPWKSPWLRHGFQSLVEHGVTRGADAAVAVGLIMALPAERYSKLALAQAAVAPMLLFFFSPSSVLMRDFAAWKKDPAELTRRVRAFRGFAWFQSMLAVALAAGIAALRSRSGGDAFDERFFPLLWAFGLALAPQVSGPDRDYLRYELELTTVNFINALQRFGVIIVSLAVILLADARAEYLASGVWLILIGTALLSRLAAENRFSLDVPMQGFSEAVTRIWESSRGFSLWAHLGGVIFGTLLGFPVLLAGLMRIDAASTGIFAAASKLANFSLAIPLALSQAFTLWLSRRVKPQVGSEDAKIEYRRFGVFMAGIGGLALAQVLVLLLAARSFMQLLSRGRWTIEEIAAGSSWLASLALIQIPFILFSASAPWFNARSGLVGSILRVYLPWASATVAIASFAQQQLTPDVASVISITALSSATLFVLLGMEWVGIARRVMKGV